MAASDSEYVTALATNQAEHAATPSATLWFTSVEEQIERSKSHWSEAAPFDSDEDMDEDAVAADNFRVFKHLQMHPTWGHFFQTSDDGEMIEELVVGEKFAEGMQAELYHVQVKWRGVTGFDAYDLVKDCEYALKVFKKGTLLRQLQAQWPHGLFRYHEEKNEGARVGKVVGIRYTSDVMYGVLLRDGRFAFLMVKEKEDLRSYIDRRCVLTTSQEPGPIGNGEAEMIMYNIALGMDWLHNRNIVHRDLKSSNVLLQYNEDFGEFKACLIADYECSIGVIGTGFFKAPEILQVCKDGNVRSRPEVFTKAADVYSYGMSCYEILTGKLPFEGHSYCDYDLVLKGQRPEVPKSVDDWMRELLNRCWQSSPEARPTFTEILNLFEANSALARKTRRDYMAFMAALRVEIVMGDTVYEHVHSDGGSDTSRVSRLCALVLDGHLLELPEDADSVVFKCIDMCWKHGLAIPTFGSIVDMLPFNSELRKQILESVLETLMQNEDVSTG